MRRGADNPPGLKQVTEAADGAMRVMVGERRGQQ